MSFGFEFEVFDKRAEFLRGRAYNATSQFGEDGLIEAALEKIGLANRWCFEVGAGDGVTLSNTKQLRDQGWIAVLIEADKAKYDQIEASLSAGAIFAYNEKIIPGSLDRILKDCGAPRDLDFGVIDIDGQDYWVWLGMHDYKPRLLLVEYSPYGTADDVVLLNGEGQAGLNPIIALGREKGYFPMCRTNVNVLFCREDAWKD